MCSDAGKSYFGQVARVGMRLEMSAILGVWYYVLVAAMLRLRAVDVALMLGVGVVVMVAIFWV